VAALVTLDAVEVGRWAEANGLTGDLAALAIEPRVVELVQAAVDDANRDRTRFEQIKRFAILPRDFTLEQGELTPTLKLRRRVCIEHFSDEVDRLYADA
jgi:long-chain acyl-CoA synthetase